MPIRVCGGCVAKSLVHKRSVSLVSCTWVGVIFGTFSSENC